MQVPVQYRLLYLLMFLYAHQNDKVIVFASNCETVNLIYKICKEIDWNLCVNKRGQESSYTGSGKFEPQFLFGSRFYKLHGNMDHSERKQTYFNFDKN
jgi:superfamily II DNA/RNA helicase